MAGNFHYEGYDKVWKQPGFILRRLRGRLRECRCELASKGRLMCLMLCTQWTSDFTCLQLAI